MGDKNSNKNRNYCFTIFDLDKYESLKPDLWPEDIKYMVYQKEKCPSTSKEHIQGYVEFHKPCRINYVKKLFNCSWMHLEKRLGSQEDAINYCKKEDTRIDGPWEYGKPSHQGVRTDIDCLHKLEFMKLSNFVIENPVISIKYPNGIKLLKQCFDIKLSKTKIRDVHCTLLLGRPGSGKTLHVYKYNNPDNIYKLNTNSNGSLWFDGYENEDILLIDDFKGWIRYTELLTILDHYPYRCQLKGSFTYANWTKIFITSNYEIDEWYDKSSIDIDALKRRINSTIYID